MQECCAIRPVHSRQRRALRVVLAINLGMFLIEAAGGIVGRSTALLADSADMLGDSIAYGFSLYVVARGPAWQTRAATVKGVIMAAFGIGVLIEAVAKVAADINPSAEVMSAVGLLALLANVSVLTFLSRHRADDLNMRSAWLCSRNDVIANVGVLLAAVAVALTGSGWPDVLVGGAISALFLAAAVDVLRATRRAPVTAPSN